MDIIFKNKSKLLLKKRKYKINEDENILLTGDIDFHSNDIEKHLEILHTIKGNIKELSSIIYINFSSYNPTDVNYIFKFNNYYNYYNSLEEKELLENIKNNINYLLTKNISLNLGNYGNYNDILNDFFDFLPYTESKKNIILLFTSNKQLILFEKMRKILNEKNYLLIVVIPKKALEEVLQKRNFKEFYLIYEHVFSLYLHSYEVKKNKINYRLDYFYKSHLVEENIELKYKNIVEMKELEDNKNLNQTAEKYFFSKELDNF